MAGGVGKTGKFRKDRGGDLQGIRFNHHNYDGDERILRSKIKNIGHVVGVMNTTSLPGYRRSHYISARTSAITIDH